ncbi:MAG: hypothetical protein HYU66_14365 [Armatimonadetes bacterium]|nr:hypothetical protein [Armatimonadota bacterium]
MAEDEPHVEPEHEHEHGDSCACCGGEVECPLDQDDMAMVSLGTGVAAMVFGVFGWGTWPHFLALPLGVLAVASACRAVKCGTQNKKQATKGMVFGVIGLCAWLIGTTWHEAWVLLHR